MDTKDRDFKVNIGGGEWVVRFTNENLGLGELGVCSYDLKKIIVDPRDLGRETVDTLIHEVIHAVMPNIAEEYVNMTANAVVNSLVGARMLSKKWTKEVSCEPKDGG